MIIGFSGYAQTGKDTAADHVVEKYGYTKYSFIEPVRKCLEILNPIVEVNPRALRYNEAEEIYGYETAKRAFPEFRRLLQDFGTEVGREYLGWDIWCDTFFRNVYDHAVNYVLSSVRFPNEAQFITRHVGTVIRITRPGKGPINDHVSETALDGYDFEYHITNNGDLPYLYREVDAIVDHYTPLTNFNQGTN